MSLLLYKPSFACFFGMWLLFERQWKMAVIALLSVIPWFGFSVLATGGNIRWIHDYLHLLRFLQSYETFNSYGNITLAKSIEALPLHASPLASYTCGAIIALLLVAPLIAMSKQLSQFERFIVVMLIVLLLSPHVMVYDAVFALPVLFRIASIAPVGARIAQAFCMISLVTVLFFTSWLGLFAVVLTLPFTLLWALKSANVSPPVDSIEPCAEYVC